MPLNVCWGNSLESLADALFDKFVSRRNLEPGAVFNARDCIVVPNRIQQAWLQHRFLFDLDRSHSPVPHVLANCDFPLIGLFVADWLHRMDHPGNSHVRPDPEANPFSVKSIRWNILELLRNAPLSGEFSPLERYVLRDGKRDPRKCFKLAGRIASLFEQYQLFRPEMMMLWESSGVDRVDPSVAWQPALWRILIRGRETLTPLSAFGRMKSRLGRCKIDRAYRHVFVFAPSMLPTAHLEFFRLLGDFLPVDFFMFNPASVDWFDRDSIRKTLKGPGLLDRPDDDGDPSSFQHPLLDAYARGARDLVSAALDLAGGQFEEAFVVPRGNSVLHALQRSLVACDASLSPTPMPPDASIQIHLCHGKMREVEILRDQLLKCFDEMPGMQPRHVQVQVADLDAYAPYVEAVFSSANPNAKDAIPFAIADQVAAGESRASETFRRLLDLPDGRFSATQLLDILRFDGVARKFGLEPADVDEASAWLNKAGVRWGRDRLHRKNASGADFTEATSWRHGLDRLLLGFAMGIEPSPPNPADLLPCDCAEGDGAVRLGRLARFFQLLADFADFGQIEHPPIEWSRRLELLVDDFFVADDESYRDVAILKSAIRLLDASAESAGFSGNVPVSVVRDFLAGRLGETSGGRNLNRNAVVFNSLRPGSSTPRRVQCLLGMGDGLYPRTDNRPAYDLLRLSRKMGDRSAAIEDRLAFLEVLMNAGERLLVFYPARSEEDNASSCESVVVRELLEFLSGRFASGDGAPPALIVRHRLQPWHPAYFAGTANAPSLLFSYSRPNCDAAKALLSASGKAPPLSLPPPRPSAATSIGLPELVRFFENPAKHFFNHVLGADPRPNPEAMPSDAEPFEPNALEKWKARSRLLDAMAKGDDPNERKRIHREFISSGAAPLGQWGLDWWKDMEREVDSLLAKAIPPLGSLREALAAKSIALNRDLSASVSVDGCSVSVHGSASWLPNDHLLDFHCSSFKARRLLPTWLAHLLACSAGEQPTSINAQGTDSVTIAAFPPIPPETAKSLLTDCLRVFLFQSSPPPPFSPETAWAFVGELRGVEENASRALAKAKNAWDANAWSHGDGRDPYFLACFGKAGPFIDESAFAALARLIMEPIWLYAQTGNRQ